MSPKFKVGDILLNTKVPGYMYKVNKVFKVSYKIECVADGNKKHGQLGEIINFDHNFIEELCIKATKLHKVLR